jgi:hypothetical protein
VIGVFTVLTVLAVPALLFSTSGSGMLSNQDVTGFYRGFVSNIGLPCAPDTGVPALVTGCNTTAETTQSVYGNKVTLPDISLAVMTFEFAG